MQNRYVADIGDYGKYGMLRYIVRTNLILGVNWYLTPDEDGNEDGKHISYLNKDDYLECDKELYNILKEIIIQNRRNIDNIQQLDIFSNNTLFYKEILDYSNEPD